jgi:type VI secretion system protein ImpJ
MQILKPTLPVQWHEGMLLSPQHFQQEAESLRGTFAFHQALAMPYGWGFETLQIDESLLPAGRVRLLTARLIFPDGTAVCYDAQTDDELTLDLKAEDAAFDTGPVDLFLRLPIQPQLNTPQRLGRYRPVVQAPIEDSVSEALPIDIPRLGLALSLSLGAPPSGAFTAIRMGRLISVAGVFRLDSTLPPLLRLHCAQGLIDRIRSLLGGLRSKASFVARQVAGLEKPELLAERTLMQQRLTAMVVGLPMAEAVAQSPQATAWQAYMALVQLHAQLSQLNPATVPSVPPAYDHNNPSLSFNPLLESLEQLVLEISQDYREIRFSWSQNGFELELQPSWLNSRLVVGLHGESEQAMTDWMELALIGESGELDELMERRILGLRRLRVASAEELGLRPLPKTVFFEIQPGSLLNSESPQLVIRSSSRTGPLSPPRSVVLYVANQVRPRGPQETKA